MSTRWTDTSLRTAHVPWTHQDWREVAATLTDAVNAFTPSSTKPAEFTRHLVALAVGINVAEGTLPSIDKDLAIALVKEYLEDKAAGPAAVPWNAEGTHNSTAATERQLYQTCAAAKYLLRDNADVPLSKDLVVQTHALLMKGSVNDDGSPVVTNRMRRLASESVGAGTYTFVPPRAVEGCVAALVESFHQRLASGKVHPVSLATHLFYELITVHPFGNGNGRLCRLFLAWSLVHTGFPFPVMFSSGHKRSRQHYLHAIHTARRGNMGELNVLCLVSTTRALCGTYHGRIGGDGQTAPVPHVDVTVPRLHVL
jgi:hypothetical protein